MACCGRSSITRSIRPSPEQVFVQARGTIEGVIKIAIGKNQVARVGVGLPPICIAKSAALANVAYVEILGPCSNLQPAA